VKGSIQLLRCNAAICQATETYPDDIKLTQPFIGQLLHVVCQSCDLKLVNLLLVCNCFYL